MVALKTWRKAGFGPGDHPRHPRVSPTMFSNRLYFALTLTVPLALTTWFYQEYIRNTYVVCSKSQKIYTVDESLPNAACISIHNTRIVAVGELGNHFPSYLLLMLTSFR